MKPFVSGGQTKWRICHLTQRRKKLQPPLHQSFMARKKLQLSSLSSHLVCSTQNELSAFWLRNSSKKMEPEKWLRLAVAVSMHDSDMAYCWLLLHNVTTVIDLMSIVSDDAPFSPSSNQWQVEVHRDLLLKVIASWWPLLSGCNLLTRNEVAWATWKDGPGSATRQRLDGIKSFVSRSDMGWIAISTTATLTSCFQSC